MALQLTGVNTDYLFAAESNDYRRAQLQTIIGSATRIYDDATDARLIMERHVDVLSATFSCSHYSGVIRNSTPAIRTNEVALLDQALEYVRAQIRRGTPVQWIILENSEGLMLYHFAHMVAVCNLLAALHTNYKWKVQWLCPSRHANIPNARPRIYWLGTWLHVAS